MSTSRQYQRSWNKNRKCAAHAALIINCSALPSACNMLLDSRDFSTAHSGESSPTPKTHRAPRSLKSPFDRCSTCPSRWFPLPQPCLETRATQRDPLFLETAVCLKAPQKHYSNCTTLWGESLPLARRRGPAAS